MLPKIIADRKIFGESISAYRYRLSVTEADPGVSRINFRCGYRRSKSVCLSVCLCGVCLCLCLSLSVYVWGGCVCVGRGVVFTCGCSIHGEKGAKD